MNGARDVAVKGQRLVLHLSLSHFVRSRNIKQNSIFSQFFSIVKFNEGDPDRSVSTNSFQQICLRPA